MKRLLVTLMASLLLVCWPLARRQIRMLCELRPCCRLQPSGRVLLTVTIQPLRCKLLLLT